MQIAPARRKPRERLILPITEARRIRQRLVGFFNGQASSSGYVCSEPWAHECLAALESGRLQSRKKMQHLEADLYKRGIYPPGGSETRMLENPRTMRYVPPDYNGDHLEEYEDTMSFVHGCRLPSSPSAEMIERIRHLKSRHEKRRLRLSRK